MLKAFSAVYLSSIPIFLLYISKCLTSDKRLQTLPSFLWMTFPAAWWYGKILGPELPSVFFGLASLLIILAGKRFFWIGYLFLGISIGIKLNGIVFLFFLLFYFIVSFLLQRGMVKKEKILPSLLSLVLGFVISTPIVLFNFATFIQNLNKVLKGFSLDSFWLIFQNERWFWDSVHDGGLLDLSLSFGSFVVLFCMVLTVPVNNKRIFISVLLTMCTTILMLLKETYLGWYWYPFIVLLPLVIISFKPTKEFKSLSLFLIMINLFIHLPIISDRIGMRVEHNSVLSSRVEIKECLDDLGVTKLNSIRFIEFGYENSDNYGVFRNLTKGHDYSGRRFIVIGNRVMRHSSYLSLSIIKENLEEYGFSVVEQHDCFGINILEYENLN